ncbi:MAG: hypothetical protein E7505_05510 [Ruminococcus sp.]|nr:hypothetical protein [Ruminococcus sp.]
MRKVIKNILSILTVSAMLSAAPCVSAAEAYDVYSYDRWGEAVPSQAGYTAERSVSGAALGTEDFSGLSDIFRTDSGIFYIVDSGNNRIVVANEKLDKVIRIYDSFEYNGTSLSLESPQSIFVSENGKLYIADTENSRILVSDENGKVELLIEKPESELYSAVTFWPRRIIADDAGYIYAVVDNITSGSVMFDSSGKFSGFYGANRVQQTSEVIKNYFWKLFANETMRKYMTSSVPAAITSFDIDKDGFVYTCNSSLTQELDSIKKVDASGYNLFADINAEFGDKPTADYSEFPQNSYVDIDVNSEGLISCLDYTNGRVFQYDEDCNLLFIFGGKGNQLGTFRQVSAIESSVDNVYVADSQKNTITVFSETSFGKLVHEATRLYNDGYYEEALTPWFEVLKRDGNYRRAYIGIASAYINRGEYEEAMKYAELADSQWRYDRAFEGYREEFISENLSYIVWAVIIFSAAVIFLRRFKKKHKEASGGHEDSASQISSGKKGDDEK